MIGMIFAAGLGTRLRPLTNNCPKALIDVAGSMAIVRVIKHISEVGINRIIVNVHHKADMLIDFLKEYSEYSDIDLIISDERDKLLDTGGGLCKALELLDQEEEMLVYNADIMTNVDLGEMIRVHQRDDTANVTLLVSPERKSSRRLIFDSEGLMRGWINETTGVTRPSDMKLQKMLRCAFGGIHIIGIKTLNSLQSYRMPGESFSITDFYIDNCSSLNIKPYIPERSYYWFDIGKPDTLNEARTHFSKVRSK